MHLETSCGAIVYTRREGQYLFVIVQEKSGAYSFPKGHMEGSETEIETARREIFEEKPGTRKQVVYFLAECGNEPMVAQKGEIRKTVLLPYDRAIERFEWEGTRRVLTSAYHFLTGR